MKFHKKGEPLSGWKLAFVAFGNKFVGKFGMLMFGCSDIKQKKSNFDYSKYLGPDWKKSYECPGTIIGNHTVFMDILIHMYRQPPSHVAKAAVENLPFIGSIASACGCLYLDRGDGDSRKDMFTQIAERQQECEKGIYPPLIIYPEGGTSNGTHLLKFKKGAFAGLRSVQPIIIKYHNPIIDNECCAYNFLAHSILYASCAYSTVCITSMPVFSPNDYFFKNY